MPPTTADTSEQASITTRLPRGLLYLILGLGAGGGGVYGVGALSQPKHAEPVDVQAIARAEADIVRKDCDSKLERALDKIDRKLGAIETTLTNVNTSLIGLDTRLRFVENDRLLPRGSLSARPNAASAP